MDSETFQYKTKVSSTNYILQCSSIKTPCFVKIYRCGKVKKCQFITRIGETPLTVFISYTFSKHNAHVQLDASQYTVSLHFTLLQLYAHDSMHKLCFQCSFRISPLRHPSMAITKPAPRRRATIWRYFSAKTCHVALVFGMTHGRLAHMYTTRPLFAVYTTRAH